MSVLCDVLVWLKDNQKKNKKQKTKNKNKNKNKKQLKRGNSETKNYCATLISKYPKFSQSGSYDVLLQIWFLVSGYSVKGLYASEEVRLKFM